MRKFTTEHTVYDFDELSDEAKQKAIENERESMSQWGFDFLPDDLAYRLEELLKQHKITYDELPKVYYSLNYCQGDGAMFEGTVYWRSYRVEIRQNGHYYHFNSKQFWNFESVKTGKEASDKAFNDFNDIYVSICKELERYGYDVIETALSDENIIDNLKFNDAEFYADGRLA